ncbi:hypothetical protein OIE68_04570 [Nocardia vinacea]|uniref:hypothetical protein n=1 Tax=Nocardia vinacea TaxID=96468 RepID=UPI002E127652|nr:hypothetical protein OIE68_04570 [Nocardia vinacea]
MAATALLTARGEQYAPSIAMTSGLLLIGWIVVQLAVIRHTSWLQPVCVLLGSAVFVLGWAGRRR